MNTIEGNKLIAEFMQIKMVVVDGVDYPADKHQWEITLLPHYKEYSVFGTKEYTFEKLNFQYYSSWDWLYEPYKKFFSLTEFDTITDGKYHNRNPHFVARLEDLQKAWSSLDIKRAFEQLVISIEWYNKEQEVKESDTTMLYGKR